MDFRVDDWSGGITDHYLNGPQNVSFALKNLLVDRNKKLIVRPGSEIEDETNYEIPTRVRISKLFLSNDQLFKQSERDLYYIDGGAYNQLLGPTSNSVFGAGTVDDHIAVTSFSKYTILTTTNLSTPRMIYKDDSAVWQTRNLGLPELASSPVVTLTAGADTLSYGYAFVYVYTFLVGTVTHTWRGPPTYVTASGAGKDEIDIAHPAAITAIPSISNGSTENYDTTTIEIEIYRTEDASTEYRKVGSVGNDINGFAVSFNDNTADGVDWAAGIRLYTSGGVFGFDPPPSAKFVEMVNGVCWFGNMYGDDLTEERPNRLRQSLVNQPWACPASLTVDLDEDITGLSSVDVYLIAFERNATWRIEGAVDSLGRGIVRKRKISWTVGTVSHNSIVKTKKGVYFAAEDGFYFTDGFEVMKLTEHLDERYKARLDDTTAETRIYGVEDPKTKRVYWTMQSDPSTADADEIWVLDPYYGLSARSTFTTWQDAEDLDNFYATALCFVGSDLYRADHQGHTFYHSDQFMTDPVVDTSLAAEDWLSRVVVFDYTSAAWAFGDEINKKYATMIHVVLKNDTNVSLQVQTINDDRGVPNARDLKEIRFRDSLVWGDEEAVWGDDIVWDPNAGAIRAERRFPAGTLRFLYKQVRMTNSLTVIQKSDDYGTATVAAGAKTVTLNTPLTSDWFVRIVGSSIYFEADDYEQGFEILARTSDDVLTVADPTGLLVNGSTKWEIKGHRKGERMNLQSYIIPFIPYGESTPGFQDGDEGGNA